MAQVRAERFSPDASAVDERKRVRPKSRFRSVRDNRLAELSFPLSRII